VTALLRCRTAVRAADLAWWAAAHILAGSLLHAQRAENAPGEDASRKFERLAPRCGLCQDPSNVVE